MLENIKISSNNINNVNNNLNRPKQAADPDNLASFDILDPTRINKPTKQDGATLNQSNISKNPYSVAEKLLLTLDASPSMTENMRKILFNKHFINSGIKTNPMMKAFYEEFVKDISMDNEKMLKFLQFQQNNYNKFSGDFFDFLRSAVNMNPTNDLKNVVANFMKSYDCYLSVNDTTYAIHNVLKQICDNMPDILKETFNSFIDKLILDNPTNGADINLNIIKDEIIPYLGKYISKTNDFGIVRDYISVLVHNVVRLESGSKDNFTANVEGLFNYLRFTFNLSDKDVADLKFALINGYRERSEVKNNTLDYMFKMIDEGLNDKGNSVNKTTFTDIAQSLLVSNNVQIPLIHMFLPVNYNGLFMFSELWINKEYDNSVQNDKDKSKSNDNINEMFKIFITFDVEKLGYFETVLFCKQNKLSLELFVPTLLSGASDKIKKDVKSIIEKNGIEVSDIYINESTKKRKFNEVFGTKFIKERGINVIA